jgi:hypothetical protein
MMFVPLQIASVAGIPESQIGLASGLVNAFLQIGGAIGLAVLSTISITEFNGVSRLARTPLAYAKALVSGYQHAFLAAAILIGVGAVIVLLFLPQGGDAERDSATATDSMVAMA